MMSFILAWDGRFQTLKMGAVPIIPANPTLYRHLLPHKNAAIFLDDFKDLKEAANYIQ